MRAANSLNASRTGTLANGSPFTVSNVGGFITLSISNVQTTNAGSSKVDASNACGIAVSNTASLNVRTNCP